MELNYELQIVLRGKGVERIDFGEKRRGGGKGWKEEEKGRERGKGKKGKGKRKEKEERGRGEEKGEIISFPV